MTKKVQLLLNEIKTETMRYKKLLEEREKN